MKLAKTSVPKITAKRMAVVRVASISMPDRSPKLRMPPRSSAKMPAPPAPIPAASVGVKMPK